MALHSLRFRHLHSPRPFETGAGTSIKFWYKLRSIPSISFTNCAQSEPPIFVPNHLGCVAFLFRPLSGYLNHFCPCNSGCIFMTWLRERDMHVKSALNPTLNYVTFFSISSCNQTNLCGRARGRCSTFGHPFRKRRSCGLVGVNGCSKIQSAPQDVPPKWFTRPSRLVDDHCGR